MQQICGDKGSKPCPEKRTECRKNADDEADLHLNIAFTVVAESPDKLVKAIPAREVPKAV